MSLVEKNMGPSFKTSKYGNEQKRSPRPQVSNFHYFVVCQSSNTKLQYVGSLFSTNFEKFQITFLQISPKVQITFFRSKQVKKGSNFANLNLKCRQRGAVYGLESRFYDVHDRKVNGSTPKLVP